MGQDRGRSAGVGQVRLQVKGDANHGDAQKPTHDASLTAMPRGLCGCGCGSTFESPEAHASLRVWVKSSMIIIWRTRKAPEPSRATQEKPYMMELGMKKGRTTADRCRSARGVCWGC